jgi:hypothetical protein
MLKCDAAASRAFKTAPIDADLCIVGGGLAGVCCAITAARSGIKVALVQDRPVLGGNASSEVRLWVLGATSHMGNNNRWSREGGVIDEILVENAFRNPEGNPLIFDTILLEKVALEPNIRLLLNTSVHELTKHGRDRIASVRGFCSQNSTVYDIAAPLFCDASGDGVVGFLAGAAFRMGAESSAEFGEKFAPSRECNDLLGHSLYFYTKDTGRPVEYVPPSFALADITQIPRYRMFNAKEHGCQLWWIEYGGRLDTIHDAEQIKWELWRVVYGVWNYIKNSGKFPESKTLTLEWVGHISGKRESRRFEGDYILTQQDLVDQRTHDDAVSFGGWAIDMHPADGVFSEKPACEQWHVKGVYQIPYRSMYSRNIENLFLAGRLISASHVAFASTRVMATCAHNGQAVGIAAAMCRKEGLVPRQLTHASRLTELQHRLQRVGQFIPHIARCDPNDLAQHAAISASSSLTIHELPSCGELLPLTHSWAMLLPLKRGRVPQFTFQVDAATPTELVCELRTSSRRGNFTPDIVLADQRVALAPSKATAIPTPHARHRAVALVGSHRSSRALPHNAPNENGNGFEPTTASPSEIALNFDVTLDRDQYVFVCLHANKLVSVFQSAKRVTGVLALRHGADKRVAEGISQVPPADIGVDAFELWSPARRPAGQNLAVRIQPALDCFQPENVVNGIARPTEQANAWVAAWHDLSPRLTLSWPQLQSIGRVELSFDTDFDHPLESVLMGHPECNMPFCIRQFRILDERGQELARCDDNHQTRRTICFERPVTTSKLHVELQAPSANVPAALFEIRCYSESRTEGTGE